MRTIHKFPLKVTDSQRILIQPGADLLHVDFQFDTLCLWAEIPDDGRAESRELLIRIFGTGNPMPAGDVSLKYIGTAQQFGGNLIWHIYLDVTP